MKVKLVAVTPVKQKEMKKDSELSNIGKQLDKVNAELEAQFSKFGAKYDPFEDYSFLDIYETISTDSKIYKFLMDLIHERNWLRNLEQDHIDKIVGEIIEECKPATSEIDKTSDKEPTEKKTDEEDWLKERCRIIQFIDLNCDTINEYENHIQALEGKISDYEMHINALNADNKRLKEQLEMIDWSYDKHIASSTDATSDPKANPVKRVKCKKVPKIHYYPVISISSDSADLLRFFRNFY